MPYTPAATFNYTPMSLDQIQGGGNQTATQGQDFARWAAEKGIDLVNLARADRNSQLAVQNAFNQQQADRSYSYEQQQFGASEQQRRLANEAAIRQENWSRSLQNPVNRQMSPLQEQLALAAEEERKKRLAESERWSMSSGGFVPGATSLGSAYIGYPAGYGGSSLTRTGR